MAGDLGSGSTPDVRRLAAEQREIRIELTQDPSPSRRAALIDRLARNRQELAALWDGGHVPGPAGPGDEQPSPDTASTEPAGPPPSPEAVDEIDVLLGELTVGGPGRAAGPVVPAAPGRWRSLGLAGVIGAVAMVVVMGLGFLAWSAVDGDGEDGTNEISAGAETVDIDHEADEIRLILGAAGLTDVDVVVDGTVIRLVGTVPSDQQLDGLLQAAQTYEDGGVIIDTSLLVVGSDAATTGSTGPAALEAADPRVAALQRELDRILDATPIVFSVGQTDLSELQQRVLNNVATILQGYPELTVEILGYTDDLGAPDANATLSAERATSVRDYLVGLGVPAGGLTVAGRGESAALGGSLAGLDRRVEFHVVGAGAPQGPLRVALVAPSARNDLAFTQSMVDALGVVAGERAIQVDVRDNTFVASDVAAAAREYAVQGYDLVIVHGSQFGPELLALAAEYPDVTFAWGTAASDSTVAPNVYAYQVAAEQGGYVLGALASTLSGSGTLGVVGPIEVGDAKAYIDGFAQGAQATRPGVNVKVAYTGTFSDIAIAAETARAHTAAGADVLTGSSQMVTGAISAAQEANAVWIGNQSDQSSLAPANVVASQVYHWEVVLRPILDDVASGNANGRVLRADLANNGIAITLNPNRPLAPEHVQLVETLVAGIKSGTGPGPR